MLFRLVALSALSACTSDPSLGTTDAAEKRADFCTKHPSHWKCVPADTGDPADTDPTDPDPTDPDPTDPAYDCAVTNVSVPDPDFTDGGVVEYTITNLGTEGTYCELQGRAFTGDGENLSFVETDYGVLINHWEWVDAGTSVVYVWDLGFQLDEGGGAEWFNMDDLVNTFVFADMCAYAEGQDAYAVDYDSNGAMEENADNACLCAESGDVPTYYDGYWNTPGHPYPEPGCGGT